MAVKTAPKEAVTRNFFAPFRTTDMDTDTTGAEAMPLEEAVPGKTDRPPPIVVTSATNLTQLQKQLKSVVKENSVEQETGPELLPKTTHF